MTAPAYGNWNLKRIALWSAGLLAYGALYYAFSDTLSLSTYYPSPMGIYSTLYSTNNTWLATTPGSQVVIGTKKPTSSATLDVEAAGGVYVNGQATVAGIASATGGLQLPTLDPPPACTAGINGTMILTTNNGQSASDAPYYCDKTTGNWLPVGSGSGSAQIIVGSSPSSNPTCPSNTVAIDYYYTNVNCTARYAGGGSCTTPAGWQSQGYGTCFYDATEYGYQNYACWGPSTPSGCICQSSQWIAVKCAPTSSVTPSGPTVAVNNGTNPGCASGQHATSYYYTGTTCTGNYPSPNYCGIYSGTYTPDSCTMAPGWFSSPNTCTYQSRLIVTGSGSSPWGDPVSICSISGPTATCTANQWSMVQCAAN